MIIAKAASFGYGKTVVRVHDISQSRNDLTNDAAIDVDQTVIAAAVAEGKAIRVEAELPQERRVQIVNVHGIAGDGQAKLVGLAVIDAAAEAAAGNPVGEAAGDRRGRSATPTCSCAASANSPGRKSNAASRACWPATSKRRWAS